MSAPGARIADRGYQHYDGERGGVGTAVRSVFWLTWRRALGLGRPARAKVFPILAIVLAYVPTAVYIGVVVLGNRLEDQTGLPSDALTNQLVPTYAKNYLQVTLAILMLAAFVAPEVLCPDRRNGMLGLYLASPLTGATYLIAKALAVLAVVSIVTLGPPILLLIAYATQGRGPAGLAAWLATIGRIIAAGLAVSVLFSAVSLAISSITSRKAAASAAFVALIIGSFGLVGYLVTEGGQSDRFGLLNLATLPYEVVFRIFGEQSEVNIAGGPELPAGSVVAAYFA